MKLSDIPPGSDLAYRRAAKLIAEQIEFELETCRQLYGTDPERVLDLLASTPDWAVFLEDGRDRLACPANSLTHLTQFESDRRGES
jgi:hypothetical protein